MIGTDKLTVDEIATDCRVHVTTVRKWIRSHGLRAFRCGKIFLVERADYEAWYAAHISTGPISKDQLTVVEGEQDKPPAEGASMRYMPGWDGPAGLRETPDNMVFNRSLNAS